MGQYTYLDAERDNEGTSLYRWLIGDTPDGAFPPEDVITREEAAVILMKASAFLGKSAERGGIAKFADREQISNWAYESVDMAAAAGLISGVTDSEFQPRSHATRARCVNILSRLLTG